jgi:hypothetical protein
MYMFLENIVRVFGCPVVKVLRIYIATKMNMFFIRDENVVKVVII